jgi:hypothetical protein
MSTEEYIPGTCNIGKSEVKRRQSVALVGAIATIAWATFLILKVDSHALRFSTFIPAMAFAVGWVQSRRKFCLAFGLMGSFNFGKAGNLSKVQSEADKAADRATALSILRQAIILAIAITGIVYFWPY